MKEGTQVTLGIKSIGYTPDGLVFFNLLTTYNNEPIETVVQFSADNAVGFCKCLMEAATKARESVEPKEVDN